MGGPLDDVTGRYRGGGFNARETVRHDFDIARCYTCRKEHALRERDPDQAYRDFAFRHPAEAGHVVVRLSPDRVRAMVDREQRRRAEDRRAVRGFTHNASVLEAFQSSDQSLDLTSWNSLGNSATSGWSSNYWDNSSNLYLDYLLAVTLSLINTAPGSDQFWYFYAAASLNTTDRPATGASSGVCPNSASTAGPLTFPSISTTVPVFPIAFKLPYNTQNIAQQSPIFSYARALGGFPGLFNWLPAINFSGMTNGASGNAIKYRGVYNTVA